MIKITSFLTKMIRFQSHLMSTKCYRNLIALELALIIYIQSRIISANVISKIEMNGTKFLGRSIPTEGMTKYYKLNTKMI